MMGADFRNRLDDVERQRREDAVANLRPRDVDGRFLFRGDHVAGTWRGQLVAGVVIEVGIFDVTVELDPRPRRPYRTITRRAQTWRLVSRG